VVLVGGLLTAFVLGLELLCLLAGLGLSEADAPLAVWKVWQLALLSIPVTGFAAAWGFSRLRRATRGQIITGGLGSLLGLLAAGYWTMQVNAMRAQAESLLGGMVASLALMAALLLLSAGLALLRVSRRRAPKEVGT
jgi:hypothetical protein